MFGFGAAWYLDLFVMVGVALPVLCARGVVLARRGEYARHRAWQRMLFFTFTVAILALEAGIRLGGVGAGIQDSPYLGTALLRNTFYLHVGIAIITYIAWLYLVVKASRFYERALPGAWSAGHRRLGIVVLLGFVLTGASALVSYVIAFVL